MEYLDLAPYEYSEFPIPMLSIGWLGREHGIQRLGSDPSTATSLTRVKTSSRRLGSLTLGMHLCEFCPDGHEFTGNGEYRYYAQGGEVFAAPMMITHYIEDHQYCPPAQFVNSLAGLDELEWDWRAEILSKSFGIPSKTFTFAVRRSSISQTG